MANPIRFSDIFDFTSDKGIQEAIKKIKSLDKVYTAFIANSKKLKSQYASDIQQVVKATEQLTKVVNGLNPAIKKDQQQLAAAAKSMDILTASSQGLTQKTATLGTTIKKLESEQKKFNKSASETVRLEKEEARLKARLNSLDTARAQKVASLKAQIAQKNKELRKSAQESLKLVSIYDRESNRLAELAKRYKDYVVSGREGSRAARQLKKEHDALRASIVRADQATGVFSKNVGNYPKKFAAAASVFRQLASALGFSGVVLTLINAFKNGFNAIRAFDKEMTNMAAIVGKTRPELSGLETEIRRIAGSSINTANEVAKTATALFTLGKTETEIIDLLEPVNQLAIALQAPADEAGELLIQTLNAFGKSSDSAKEYADIIAKMRTSTALDFERIKESLGFLAPVAKAVGLDFAETGAILGTLVDNGIRASRAGRLMSTSFGRLAQDGITLNQALAKIKGSTDKTTTAMDLFGAESFALALILAENTQKTKEYTESFRDAAGSLQSLTDKQLVSMDAKIRILGSAWEELWITMGEGDGILDRFARGFIDTVTEAIVAVTNLDLILKTAISSLDSLSDKEVTKLIDIGLETDSGKKVKDFYKIVENTPFPEVIKEVDKYRDQVVGALVAEGEALDESTRFFNAWYNEKLKGYKTAQTAQQLFDKAQKDGLETFSDFEDAGIKFFYRDQAHQLQILSMVQEKYNNKLGKSKKETEGVVSVTEKWTDADTIEFFEKFGLASVNAAKTTVKNLKGVDDEIKTNIPNSLDEYETKTKTITNKLKFYWKQFANDIKGAITAAFEVATIAVNQFFTNQSIKRDNAFVKFEEQQQAEIDAIEKRREKDLENEDLTTKAKKAINEKYNTDIETIENEIEARRKELQRRQARAEKAQAIFNAIINTAAAVAQTLGETGFFGIPLSAIVAALGAAQITAIASQPLPAFAKGTDSAPGGLAVVGDGGKRELVMEPSGRTYLTSDRPEIRNIPKGSKVFPDADLVDREFGSTIMNIITGQAFDREIDNHNTSVNKLQAVLNHERLNNDQFRKTLTATLEKENDYMVSKFISGLQSLPLNNWSFTDKGQVTRSIQKGNTIRKDVELENKY